MDRRYVAARYRALVEDLTARVPGLAVGADVIVGFPGEDRADFDATRDLILALPLAYLHVFSYSPRPDTPAATMDDQVQPEERHRRCLELRALSRQKRRAFLDSQVGISLSCVVVQAAAGARSGWSSWRTTT